MKTENEIPKLKLFLNRLADLNFFMMTGRYIPDVSSGFRCYSRKAIEVILPELEKVDMEGLRYGIEPYILKIAVKKGLRIGHAHTTVDYTQGKKNNLWKLFKGYLMFDLQCLKDILSGC